MAKIKTSRNKTLNTFSNQITSTQAWYDNQIVSASQMTTFSNDLYNKLAAVTASPCIVNFNTSLVVVTPTSITLPVGFFRFSDGNYSYLPFNSCIYGNAPSSSIAITSSSNGFIVARYTINPTTPSAFSYTFPTSYLFVGSVNPSTDCLVAIITNGVISSWGKMFQMADVWDDNNGNVTIKTNSGTSANLTITGTFTSKSIVDNGTNVTLSKPLIASNIHFAGDTKLSFQAANHASGNGMWMIANGQSIPTQYTQAIAIFGAKLPNITDSVMGVAGGSHLSGTSYGANLVAVPVSAHTHGLNAYNGHYHQLTIYDGHTHSLNAYNQHSHSIAHGHTASDAGHAHTTPWGDGFAAGQQNRGGPNFLYQPGTQTTATQTGYANISVSYFQGQSSEVNSAPAGSVTDVVNNANSRTDPVVYAGATDATDSAGTAGVTMGVLQPTYYTKNLFIFCC